jgi:hypothetical protein
MRMHRPIPSQATQPLNIRFGIGFMVALVLPLSNAQWLVYKKELPTFLRQACMYAWSGGGIVGVCSCVVPLGNRRRGSWLSYICISSCHSSFLVVWWFRPFFHNISTITLSLAKEESHEISIITILAFYRCRIY